MGNAVHFYTFCCFVAVLFEFSATSEKLKTPWIELGDNFYIFSNGSKNNWYDAANNCRLRDGYLVSIDRAEEMNTLSAYLMKRKKTDSYWTDGSCVGHDRVFFSLTYGLPALYLRWIRDQPNNYWGKQECIDIEHDEDLYGMNDDACDKEYHYICEKSKKPADIC